MKTNQFIYKTMGAVMIAAAMLLGSSSAFSQVKIGSNPTSINAANNLEVEASTAGRKTSIDKTTGKVTIADGSQGVDKVLTSDANGVASWQAPAVQNTDVMLSVAVAPQTVSTTNQILDLSAAAFDKGSNFNLATNQFLAPTAGYYQLSILVTSPVAIALTSGRYGYLMVNGVINRTLYNDAVSAGDGYSVYSGALLKLNAGDIVTVNVGTASGTPSYPIGGGFLEIYKISN